jgi:hypothetical protein
MATITLSDLIEEQKETTEYVALIDDRFAEFFMMMRADKLDMLEMMQELKNQPDPLVPGAVPGAPGGEVPSGGGLGVGGLLAGLLAAIAIGPALMIGFVEGVFDTLRAALKLVKLDFISTRLMEKFKNSKVFAFLDDLVVRTYVYFDDYIKKPLTNFGTFMKDKFKAIRNFFDPTGLLAKIFRPLTEGIKTVGGVFAKIGTAFGSLFGAFRAFGAVLGRIFIPIGIIMSAVDVITGAIDGFTAESGSGWDKVWGGIFGGLKGAINGLIMMPLDLLKDGISWISEKLGFENFSGMLDSFSFKDLFSNMIDKVKVIVQKINRFPLAVAYGSGAAVEAFMPGGDSPIEAFSKAFNKTMDAPLAADGTGRAEKITAAAAASIDTPPAEQLSKPRNNSDVRRESMERNALESSAASNAVTVVNNTNAPTSVSNQTSVSSSGNSFMPSATMSNGTRSDAYAGA